MRVRRFRKAAELPAAERRLVLSAYALVWLMTLCLHTVRLRRAQAIAAQAARLLALLRRRAHLPADRPGAVTWAARLAGRHVPGATCLAHALVAQVLLSSQGTPNRLCIGVAREAGGGLDAHAWVECMSSAESDGGAENYARLLSMELTGPGLGGTAPVR